MNKIESITSGYPTSARDVVETSNNDGGQKLSKISLRNVTGKEEIHKIWKLQFSSYPEELCESEEVYQSKSIYWNKGTVVAYRDDDENDVLGYGVSFPLPARYEEKIPLDCILDASTEQSRDIYYIHDISSFVKRQGVATAIMNRIIEIAKLWNFKCIRLVAICDMHLIWSKFGFVIFRQLEEEDGYGEGSLMELCIQK